MPSVRVIVRNHVPDVTRKARAGVAAAVEKAAHDIEAQAKARAPVDTGHLRSSITSRPLESTRWVVESPAQYSVFQEFGTSRMAAQPFMTPAAEMVAPQLLRALGSLL